MSNKTNKKDSFGEKLIDFKTGRISKIRQIIMIDLKTGKISEMRQKIMIDVKTGGFF